MGQYFNKNIVDLFASVKKWFSSIGWLMLINAFIAVSFYAVLLSWHIIYIFVSLGLQWKNDAKEYFLSNVLQVSSGFSNFNHFSLPIFIALIIAWVIIFFCIRNGYESMKKCFLVTTPAFLLLMFFFLFYSLTLENSLAGVYSFLKPKLSGLFDSDTWINAFSLALVSLGLSYGIMPAFARKNKGFLVGNSFSVIIFELLASIAIGFILFGILGFLSVRQVANIESLVFKDFSSEFTILAQALPFFYKPTLLSLLFFIFLSLLFVIGASSLAYAVSHVLVHKFDTKHNNAAIIVSGFGFLFGLLFILRPGYYIMDIVSHFVFYNILIAILLEVIAIAWFFDIQKISNHIDQYSILKIGKIWRFMIRYIIPLIVVLLLLFQLKSDYLLNYKDYTLIYILIFGVGVVVIPLVIAFLIPRKILDRR